MAREIVNLSGETHGLLCVSQSKDLRFRSDGLGSPQKRRSFDSVWQKPAKLRSG